MSRVYYKYSSNLEYSTVTFFGLHITLRELKKKIIGRECRKARNCDLQIFNAQTREEYTDDEAHILKHSYVIVGRIPPARVKSAGKTAIVHGYSKAVDRSSRPTANPSDANASEDDKINAMVVQSNYENALINHFKKPYGPPPAHYICYRCGNAGHLIRQCPMPLDKSVEGPKPVRKRKGIPHSYMVKAEPGTKGAMLTSTGENAIPAIDMPMKDDADLIPDELLCPICKDLIMDAAVIPCCGNSYCDDCIRTALLESEEHICFTCKQSDVSPDNLIANHFLREVVNNFKKDPRNTKPVRKQVKQEALPPPRLQMSRPLHPRQQDPLLANVTHPPRAIIPTASPQTQTDASLSKSQAQLAKTANLGDTNASGDDKINAMMLQSNSEYASINHFKKPYGPPPAHYICYRCGNAGHLIRQCPMPLDKSVEGPKPVRKRKGIPHSYMVKAEPGTKGAMLTSTGENAIPAIDIPMKDDADLIPDELLCPICKDLIMDAAVIPCCGNSYCDDCIRTALLESEEHICFTCKQSDVSPDNLIANHFLREVVNNFKKDPRNTKPVRKQVKQEALPPPRLQMSRPLHPRQQDPLLANVTHPPRAIIPTASPQTQTDASLSKSQAQLAKTANLGDTNASGDDKINAMMLQSNSEYASINHFKKPYGPPPAHYICYRCGNAGHLIRQCPMPLDKSVEGPKPVRKRKGIPHSYMVKAEPGTKGAMLTSTGENAIPAIDIPMKDDADLIPDELLCPICKDLIMDAAVIPCCGNSYCDDCIRTALLESEEHICFTCKQSDVSPDNLIANHFLREVVNNFKKDPRNTKPVRKQVKQEALPPPRLQMSRPLHPRQQDPLLANVTHPPRAIIPTASPQTQTDASLSKSQAQLAKTANLGDTNASGDDKINAMMLQSNSEYASINHFKKPYGPPPDHYICYRCGNAGHLIRQCPMPLVQPPAPSPPAPVTDQHFPIYSSGQGEPLSPGELDPEPTVRRSPESNPGIGPCGYHSSVLGLPPPITPPHPSGHQSRTNHSHRGGGRHWERDGPWEGAEGPAPFRSRSRSPGGFQISSPGGQKPPPRGLPPYELKGPRPGGHDRRERERHRQWEKEYTDWYNSAKTTTTNIPHSITEVAAAETGRGTECLRYPEITPLRGEEDLGTKSSTKVLKTKKVKRKRPREEPESSHHSVDTDHTSPLRDEPMDESPSINNTPPISSELASGSGVAIAPTFKSPAAHPEPSNKKRRLSK